MRHLVGRIGDLLLVAAGHRRYRDVGRQVQGAQAPLVIANDVRERRTRGDVRADQHDVTPLEANDQRRRRDVLQIDDVADADDRTVVGADRNRRDAGEIRQILLLVDHLHVFEAVRAGELRRRVAAEGRTHRRRGCADARVERSRRIAIEVHFDLRRLERIRGRRVDHAGRLLQAPRRLDAAASRSDRRSRSRPRSRSAARCRPRDRSRVRRSLARPAARL